MKALLIDLVIVVTVLILCCIVFSLYTIYKRQQLKKEKNRQLPLTTVLRKHHVPLIESTPFWVPSYIGHMVDIQVQPSMENLRPKFSTPKPYRQKKTKTKTPELKFSVKYNDRRSALIVELLESRHIGKGSLVCDTPLGKSPDEASFLSGTGVFSTVELSPVVNKGTAPVVRRKRKNSYEFEMSYEDLQLQCLQFSVMGFDQHSRQMVIGDVILPMAEITSQGLDVTRELIMWREIQTIEKRASTRPEQTDENLNLIESRSVDKPSKNTKCDPS